MQEMHCNPTSHPPVPGSKIVRIGEPDMVNNVTKLGYWSSRTAPSSACNGTVSIVQLGKWNFFTWANGYVAAQHEFSVYEAERPSDRCEEACFNDERCVGSYMDPSFGADYFVCNIVHKGTNIVNPKEVRCGLSAPICITNFQLWVRDQEGSEKCVKAD